MINSDRSRRLRAVNAVVSLGVIALLLGLGGCGGSGDQPEVATAGTPGDQTTGSATPDTGQLAVFVEDRRQLARCLREHGYDVPDPDAQGQIDFRSAGQKKTDPAVQRAWGSCVEFGKVPAPHEREETVSAEQLAHRRAYAACMRANGMPDWPDPAPDGTMTMPGRELTPQEQVANIRALQICEPVLDGQPPTTADPNATSRG